MEKGDIANLATTRSIAHCVGEDLKMTESGMKNYLLGTGDQRPIYFALLYLQKG